MVSDNLTPIISGLIKRFYPVVISNGMFASHCFDEEDKLTETGKVLLEEIVDNLNKEIIVLTSMEVEQFSKISNIYSKLGYTLMSSLMLDHTKSNFRIGSGIMVTAIMKREFDLDSFEVL